MKLVEFGNLRYVRGYWTHTGEMSPPMLLNRRSGELTPYVFTGEARDEWGVQREIIEAVRRERAYRIGIGIQRRSDYRMAGLFGVDDLIPQYFGAAALPTWTTVALDSAYTAGSAGDVIAARIQLYGAKTLNEAYFFITAIAGTAANVNDINLELRPESSTGAATPDTATLTEGETYDPSSTTGWHRVTGFSSAMAAASRYYLCIGDADGNGTDYATLNQRVTYQQPGLNTIGMNRWHAALSTTGWASGNSYSNAAASCIVAVFSDGSVVGLPFSSATAPSSGTQQRGLKIGTSGLVQDLKVFGMAWVDASASISGMKIYSGTNGPSSGETDASTDLIWTSGTRVGAMTASGAPVTLTAGTQYRIVATYSGSTANGPRKADIGTGEDATLRAAMPGNGHWSWTEESGGSWAGDLAGSIPYVTLLVDGWVTPAGGSGGVIGGPNMRAGMMA